TVTLITAVSNFGNQGPARAGAYQGLASKGTYDMAGNVKEWTANPWGDKRYILGGSWNEPSYMFQEPDARGPFEREPTFGFRCIKYPSPLTPALSEKLNANVVRTPIDRTQDKPADDRSFEVFTSLLSYDHSDLKPTSESVTEASHWRREKVSFQAGYGTERVILHLYLPKNAVPPYQAVFYFPGSNVLSARTPDEVTTRITEYI